MTAADSDPSLVRSRIYNIISDARASLAEPSRPFTPRVTERHLLTNERRPERQPKGARAAQAGAAARPLSAFKITAQSFQRASSGRFTPPASRPQSVGEAQVLTLDADGSRVAQASGSASVETAGAARGGGLDVVNQWWSAVEALLEMLSAPAQGSAPEVLRSRSKVADEIWSLLRSGDASARCSRWGGRSGRWRSHRLVDCLAPHMDSLDPPFLLRLARLVLACDPDPQPHGAAVRLVFKLSKEERNDQLIRKLELLPMLLDAVAGAVPPSAIAVRTVIGRAGGTAGESGGDGGGAGGDVEGDGRGWGGDGGGDGGILPAVPDTRVVTSDAASALESGLFAAGALKNVSAEPDCARALCRLGAVGAVCTVLRRITKRAHEAAAVEYGAGSGGPGGGMGATASGGGTSAILGGGSIPGGCSLPGVASSGRREGQLMAQLTMSLRNMAVPAGAVPRFVGCGGVELLCEVVGGVGLEVPEVALNAARVLAKLSLDGEVRRGARG
jgi:hypothetical protein